MIRGSIPWPLLFGLVIAPLAIALFCSCIGCCGDVIESMAARANLLTYWPLALFFALPQIVVLLWIWLVR